MNALATPVALAPLPLSRGQRRALASARPRATCRRQLGTVAAAATEDKKKGESSAEEVTRKYGLEAGLWKVLRADAI